MSGKHELSRLLSETAQMSQPMVMKNAKFSTITMSVCLAKVKCEPGTLNQLKVNQNQISIMEHLNVNKSMNHDKIGNLVLKKCHNTLSASLTLIFQTCLNEGSFPDTWKLSHVTPIFKEGNRADVSCYKPISLLCCCSKYWKSHI